MDEDRRTVYDLLEECARTLSGTYGRQEIYSWFRRHHPEVDERTLASMIQATTSNAANREANSPTYAARPALFDRVDRGLYRGASQLVQPSRAEDRQPSGVVRMPAEDHPTILRVTDEWAWEGNVQARVVAHLASLGASITRVADTRSKEQGTDIEATHSGIPIHVEVKGWPSTSYRDPRRADEVKRTAPAAQARVWFNDGVVHVLRLRTRHPNDSVGLALPAKQTYRALVDGVRQALVTLHISILWVDESGSVSVDGWTG